MTSSDQVKAVSRLKGGLASGETLGDALRSMFHEEGFGLSSLYRAVSLVQGISRREAMQLVIRETESWGGRRGAAAHLKVDPKRK
jgi:hypothetical protein